MTGGLDLSVVLPLYNGAAFVEAAIGSILAQEILPERWELIVVDDGSTDDGVRRCEAISARCPHVRVVCQGANQGVAAARNRGVMLSASEYLAFIDQDDLWMPAKWSRQLTALQQTPTADYALAHQEFLLPEDGRVPRWFNPRWGEEPQLGLVLGCLLIRRERFLDVGYFDESLRFGGDDVDWFIRARTRGLRESVCSEVLLQRRVHASNASARTAEGSRELLRVIRNKLVRKP